MSRGFTLLEMLVVIMIMMTVMAMLLPAMAGMQKKADLNNAGNVIQVVHNTQRCYSLQYGFTGAIYGYTIRSDNSASPGIRPWVITGTSVTTMSAVDVGKQLRWNSGGFIDFTDKLRAVRFDAAPGIDPKINSAFVRMVDASNNIKDLNVAFVPRAGFATISFSSPGCDPPTNIGILGSEAAGSFRLRSVLSGYRDEYIVDILKTGVLSIHAP